MLKWTILIIFVDHVGFDAPRIAHHNFQWYDFNDQESCEQALIDKLKYEDDLIITKDSQGVVASFKGGGFDGYMRCVALMTGVE